MISAQLESLKNIGILGKEGDLLNLLRHNSYDLEKAINWYYENNRFPYNTKEETNSQNHSISPRNSNLVLPISNSKKKRKIQTIFSSESEELEVDNDMQMIENESDVLKNTVKVEGGWPRLLGRRLIECHCCSRGGEVKINDIFTVITSTGDIKTTKRKKKRGLKGKSVLEEEETGGNRLLLVSNTGVRLRVEKGIVRCLLPLLTSHKIQIEARAVVGEEKVDIFKRVMVSLDVSATMSFFDDVDCVVGNGMVREEFGGELVIWLRGEEENTSKKEEEEEEEGDGEGDDGELISELKGVELYNYQKKGVRWMMRRESCGNSSSSPSSITSRMKSFIQSTPSFHIPFYGGVVTPTSSSSSSSIDLTSSSHFIPSTILSHLPPSISPLFAGSDDNNQVEEEDQFEEDNYDKVVAYYLNNDTLSLSLSPPPPLCASILADEMGLGKTVEVLATILSSSTNSSTTSTLIVCPTSVISHWYHECKRLTPLSCHIYHGQDRQSNIIKSETKGDERDSDEHHQVIITSYGVVRSEFNHQPRSWLFEKNWKRLVLDEAHVIRNIK